MVNGRRRLVWHIGHHKTGSTSIQHTLAAGGVQVDDTALLYTSAQHNYLAPHFRDWVASGEVRPGPKALPGLGRTARILSESDFDLAIFSGEDFENADATHFRRMLETFFLPHVSELQIVVYVRPHAARTRSSFAEHVKIGDFVGTIAEFHEGFRDRIMYGARLASWKEEFGDALSVRPMVRERLCGGSVVQDFMTTVLGPDVPFTVTSEHSVNESLSLEQLLLIQEFQRQSGPLEKPMRRHTGRALGRLLAGGTAPGTQTPIALHRELAEEIRTCHLPDAQLIDATYFADHPVMEAELHREVDEAIAEPQSMDVTAHLAEDVRETIRVLGRVFGVVSATSEVPAFKLFGGISEATPTTDGQG